MVYAKSGHPFVDISEGLEEFPIEEKGHGFEWWQQQYLDEWSDHVQRKSPSMQCTEWHDIACEGPETQPSDPEAVYSLGKEKSNLQSRRGLQCRD